MAFIIKNIASGLVLDVRGDHRTNGAEVILFSFHGRDNQLWEYKNNMIVSKASGLVLDISGGTHGSPIITFKGHGGGNQKWYFDDDFTIRSGTGMVLDIQGGAMVQGAKLIGFTKHGGANQKFRVVPHNRR
ncbi:hypothetical protein L9F63_015143 [Diploptera punctata]|uniref:Ricin B lectin domain-containing protein n=1 Tax=Diploptera punctata TaxID=6984 RepID=A0AAD8EK91_DIPPU|nr:hypothetical protein L9F63_015143 [Diploptera punctata]